MLTLLVSQSWQMLVKSQTIFKQILTSIKDVSDDMQRGPQRKKKAAILPTDKLVSSRQIPVQTNKTQSQTSKFSKRFNLTGTGLSQVSEQSSRISTPSTQMSSDVEQTVQKAQGDENQWIKRPSGIGTLG